MLEVASQQTTVWKVAHGDGTASTARKHAVSAPHAGVCAVAVCLEVGPHCRGAAHLCRLQALKNETIAGLASTTPSASFVSLGTWAATVLCLFSCARLGGLSGKRHRMNSSIQSENDMGNLTDNS